MDNNQKLKIKENFATSLFHAIVICSIFDQNYPRSWKHYLIKNYKFYKFILLYVKNKQEEFTTTEQKIYDYVVNTYENICGVQQIQKLQKTIDLMKISLQEGKDPLQLYCDYVKPSQQERTIRGEVFTPISLVEEMLDKLPKEVWENPKLKWLDPANGIGNFPIIIYSRLMKGLEKVIPDPFERKKHILEKMIWMVDISPKNCFLCDMILNPDDKFKLNLICEDFFKWSSNIKFDIIVGNPPYNFGNDVTVYHRFTKTATTMLEKNGFLLFIVLKGIFKKLHEKPLDVFHINYLNFEGYREDFQFNTLYFLLQNKRRENKKVQINNNSILNKILDPSDSFNPTIKQAYPKGNTFSKTPDELHKIPAYWTIKREEIVLCWSSHECNFKNQVKLVLSRQNKNVHLDDRNIGFWHGANAFVQLFETINQAKNMIILLKSKLSFYLEYQLKAHERPWENIIKNLKKINLDIDHEKFNDEYIFDQYQLDKMEIEIIEKFAQTHGWTNDPEPHRTFPEF